MALFDLLAAPHSPFRTGTRGRCARCGEGHLFSGLLKLAPQCEKCGLAYSFADPADGPAFFVMSITSFFSVAVMFMLQVTFQMPEWLLLLVTTVLITGLSLALLRPIKGWLVNSQYFYKAGEGVLAQPVSTAPCGCANCKLLYARKR